MVNPEEFFFFRDLTEAVSVMSMQGLELRETTRYGKALFAGAHLRKSLRALSRSTLSPARACGQRCHIDKSGLAFDLCHLARRLHPSGCRPVCPSLATSVLPSRPPSNSTMAPSSAHAKPWAFSNFGSSGHSKSVSNLDGRSTVQLH